MTLTAKNFAGKSLFIATPCYAGLAHADYVSSLMRLIVYLTRFDIQLYLGLITNEALITRARNFLVAQFMAKKFSHLIFIDADTEFHAEDVLRMIYYDKDVLCGACPFKTIPTKYVLKLKDDEIVDNRFPVLDNGGSGFMMIKRETLLKMFESYPELKYDLNKETIEASRIKNNLNDFAYTLFDTGTEKLEGGRINYLSEDYLFCRRWQKIGGKVLLDPEVQLNHIGNHKFLGSKLDPILNKLPKNNIDN